MSISILDLTYAAGEPLPAHRVVVRESGRTARLPDDENNLARTVLGVTTQSQSRVGASVPVRRIGIAEVEAAAAISAGDPVVIDGEDGRVRAVQMPSVLLAGTTEGTGLRMTARHLEPAFHRFTVSLLAEDPNQSLSVLFEAGFITVQLATNGSTVVTTTLAALKAALEAVAEDIFDFAVVGAGTTPVEASDYVFDTFATEGPVIGIAQDAAPGEGALVPVLLTG